jgi:uncharacterized protein (DUF4415 family)
MNTKSSILKKVLYVIIPLAIIAIVVIKLKTNKEITQSKVYQYDKEQAINVQVDTLQLENVNAEFSYSGTFEPNKETKISAELQGKINTILVDAGSVVSKGQTLIQLDNSLLKLQLQTIEVQIEGLEADVNRYTILAKADAIQGGVGNRLSGQSRQICRGGPTRQRVSRRGHLQAARKRSNFGDLHAPRQSQGKGPAMTTGKFRSGRGYTRKDWNAVSNPEPTAKQLAKARPFREAFPDLHASIKRSRGRPKVESPKEAVTLRLSPETINKFRVSGDDWRAKMVKALERAKG